MNCLNVESTNPISSVFTKFCESPNIGNKLVAFAFELFLRKRWIVVQECYSNEGVWLNEASNNVLAVDGFRCEVVDLDDCQALLESNTWPRWTEQLRSFHDKYWPGTKKLILRI